MAFPNALDKEPRPDLAKHGPLVEKSLEERPLWAVEAAVETCSCHTTWLSVVGDRLQSCRSCGT